MKAITFFDKKKEYRPLSNFWESKIVVNGREYESGELCFHGEKYTRLGESEKEEKRKKELLEYGKRFQIYGDIKTNKEAKQKGGKNGLCLNKEELRLWDELSIDVQFDICLYKFKYYEEVRKWLLKSEDSVLIHPAMRCNNEKMKQRKWEGRILENGNILGENRLGSIWMKIRDIWNKVKNEIYE